MIFGKNKESENSTSEMHVPEAVAATGMDVVETETTEKTEQTISNEAKARLQAAKLLSARLGEIVSLFMRSSGHKHFSFSDLEWLVLPALVRNQIAIAEARDLEKGLSAPIGIVMWASVSEEVDKKYSEDLNQPMRLHPDEWNSGEIFWIVDAVGNQKAVQGLITNLQKTVFRDKPVKLRVHNKEAGRSIKTLTPGASEAS